MDGSDENIVSTDVAMKNSSFIQNSAMSWVSKFWLCAFVVTGTPVRKERWWGCERVLCVHQDGSDGREKVEARGLAGAKRGVASRGNTKRYKVNKIRGE